MLGGNRGSGAVLGNVPPESGHRHIFLCLTLFHLAGGIGLVAFNDFVHKAIGRYEWGAFFGWRVCLGGGAAVLAAMVARQVLSSRELYPHPTAYSILFFFAALFLAVQILCILPMNEPPNQALPDREPLRDYFKDLIKIFKSFSWFRTLLCAKLLLGGALLATPFYVIFATKKLGQPLVTVGTYTILVMLAKGIGGLLWGKLGDRHGHKSTLIIVGGLTILPHLLAILSSVLHPSLMYGVFFTRQTRTQ